MIRLGLIRIIKMLQLVAEFAKLRPDDHLRQPAMLTVSASTMIITSYLNSKIKKYDNHALNF